MCNRILQQKLSLGEGSGGESVECRGERGREGNIPLTTEIQKKRSPWARDKAMRDHIAHVERSRLCRRML